VAAAERRPESYGRFRASGACPYERTALPDVDAVARRARPCTGGGENGRGPEREAIMNILVAHNFYKLAGGEDHCVAAEVAMLRAHGHRVTQYCLSNDDTGLEPPRIS
jgi:hypothetical protein